MSPELIRTVIICATVIIVVGLVVLGVRSMFATQANGILDAFRSQAGVLQHTQQQQPAVRQMVRSQMRERANGNDVRPVSADVD